MSGFDYAYTCPKIDKAIAGVKAEILSRIESILDEACPLLSRESRSDAAEGFAELLYSDVESAFEAVRDTNEDMRKEAEKQIRSLESNLADALAEVAQLQREAA